MKKILFLALLFLTALSTKAQNIQLHYDLGANLYPTEEATRQAVTVTFEHFRPDRLGNIFYFIDLDFYAKGTSAISRRVIFVMGFFSMQRSKAIRISLRTASLSTINGIRIPRFRKKYSRFQGEMELPKRSKSNRF